MIIRIFIFQACIKIGKPINLILKDETAHFHFFQSCREKLSILAILVMNQWPRTRLRLIQAWVPKPSWLDYAIRQARVRYRNAALSKSVQKPTLIGAQPPLPAYPDLSSYIALNPLHYEGRAVKITTSDYNEKKLGKLATLAVYAGFDYVEYKSKQFIYASVRAGVTLRHFY